jgi:hypothetical protein
MLEQVGEVMATHFKRLRIPVADSADGGHFIEAIGKLVELLDAVCEADGELFGEELGGAEEGAGRGLLTKLDHLAQRDTGGREVAVVLGED